MFGLGWSICDDKEFALASGRVPYSLHCTHKLRVQVCNDGSCLYELSREGTRASLSCNFAKRQAVLI